MKKDKMYCPNDRCEMKLTRRKKAVQFRGVKITFPEEYYLCPKCKFEAGNLRTAGDTQKAMAEAYREKADLLTAEKIVE